MPQYMRCILMCDRVYILANTSKYDINNSQCSTLNDAIRVPCSKYLEGYAESSPWRGGASSEKRRRKYTEDGDDEHIFSALTESERTVIRKIAKLSAAEHHSTPFEYSVIELVIAEVCEQLIAEATPIGDLIRRTLESPDRLSTPMLHSVSHLKRRIDTVMDNVVGVLKAITEVLECEEDLRRLELSKFVTVREDWDNPPDTANTEDMEMLLECYVQEGPSIGRRSSFHGPPIGHGSKHFP
eukprot:GHVO01013603.1.p1 GENE.GHVO01013603.1~~GHVO01013603.1.p1  ORF type:complete len:241 (+),score=44.60 GHVO01013603.1:256-978(+)